MSMAGFKPSLVWLWIECSTTVLPGYSHCLKLFFSWNSPNLLRSYFRVLYCRVSFCRVSFVWLSFIQRTFCWLSFCRVPIYQVSFCRMSLSEPTFLLISLANYQSARSEDCHWWIMLWRVSFNCFYWVFVILPSVILLNVVSSKGSPQIKINSRIVENPRFKSFSILSLRKLTNKSIFPFPDFRSTSFAFRTTTGVIVIKRFPSSMKTLKKLERLSLASLFCLVSYSGGGGRSGGTPRGACLKGAPCW